MTQPAPLNKRLRARTRAIRYDTARVTPPVVEVEPVAITLTQTDPLADVLNNKACSSLNAGGQTENLIIEENGTPGSTQRTFAVTTTSQRAHVYMLSADGHPGEGAWQAGTWTVRLHVSGDGGNGARLRSCYVCRVDKHGANRVSIAQRELDIQCSVGVKEWTMTGIGTSGSANDRVQIILGIRSTFGSVNVRITPDQDIDTPILRAA